MKRLKNILILLITLSAAGVASHAFLKNYFSPNKQSYEHVRLSKNSHGTFTEYLNNNSIKLVSNYSLGEKEGLQVFLNINGDTLKTENYKDGKLHGVSVTYNNKGIKVKEELYKNGSHVLENILNDSIYKYDILAEETGKVLFQKNCKTCEIFTVTSVLKTETNLNLDTIAHRLIEQDSLQVLSVSELKPIEKIAIEQYLKTLNLESGRKGVPLLVFRNKRLKKI